MYFHYRPKQPASINATPIDEEFIRNVDNISEILPLIWGQSSNTSSITECLRTFYEIISISGKHYTNRDFTTVLRVRGRGEKGLFADI